MKLSFVHLYPSKTDQPPLSFAYMAAYLKKYGKFKDIEIIESTFDDALENIDKAKPEIIGFSSHSIFYKDLVKLAKQIRAKPGFKDVILLIGGPHMTSLPHSFDPIFDVGIVGEGEQTMLEVMNLLRKEGKPTIAGLKKINGVAFFEKSKLVLTPIREMIEPLDNIPMLDWAMIDKSYFEPNLIFTNKLTVVVPIITSRGCPYNCVFCNATVLWGRKVRFHSAERVADEIELLIKKHNAEIIHVLDDLFTLNKKRLRDLIKEMRKRRILGKVEFVCMARSNNIDEESMILMKKLNVKRLNFGFESGSNRMLQYLKGESISIDAHKRAILLCKKYGIKPRGSFIFASPGETLDDMRETLRFMDWLKKNGAEILWSQVMTPFPDTKIWEIAKERSKIADDMEWEKLSFFNIDEPLLLDKGIDKAEFKKIFKKARAKTRYFEVKLWLDKLIHSPFATISYLLSNSRFKRFFITKKKT